MLVPPNSNEDTQFQPSDILFVNYVDSHVGETMVDVQLGQAFKLDFAVLQERVAQIRHTQDGKLVLADQ